MNSACCVPHVAQRNRWYCRQPRTARRTAWPSVWVRLGIVAAVRKKAAQNEWLWTPHIRDKQLVRWGAVTPHCILADDLPPVHFFTKFPAAPPEGVKTPAAPARTAPFAGFEAGESVGQRQPTRVVPASARLNLLCCKVLGVGSTPHPRPLSHASGESSPCTACTQGDENRRTVA